MATPDAASANRLKSSHFEDDRNDDLEALTETGRTGARDEMKSAAGQSDAVAVVLRGIDVPDRVFGTETVCGQRAEQTVFRITTEAHRGGGGSTPHTYFSGLRDALVFLSASPGHGS